MLILNANALLADDNDSGGWDGGWYCGTLEELELRIGNWDLGVHFISFICFLFGLVWFVLISWTNRDSFHHINVLAGWLSLLPGSSTP
jgi:hypothetical protein